MPGVHDRRKPARAGRLSPAELAAVSDKSCFALRSFGSRVQWMQSYVTEDKIYCIYVAPERGSDPRACAPGGIPGKPHCRGHSHHRPGDVGSRRARQ